MTKTKKFAFDMVTATVRIDPGLLLSAVSTVRLLEISLTELDIDQATRQEGLSWDDPGLSISHVHKESLSYMACFWIRCDEIGQQCPEP